MEVLRTPESCFKNIKDYPFEPVYTNIETKDGTIVSQADLYIMHPIVKLMRLVMDVLLITMETIMEWVIRLLIGRLR